MAEMILRIESVSHDDATGVLTFNFVNDDIPGTMPPEAEKAMMNGHLQITPARFSTAIKVPKSTGNPCSLIWMDSGGNMWEANWNPSTQQWVTARAAGTFRV